MPDGPIIRLADAADALRIGELDREWTPILGRGPRFQRAASKGRLLVAELDGELVGYAAQGRFFGYDFLELLAVAPGRRRQGIATALIRAIEARSSTGKLFTSTNRSNEPMQRLCERLGFAPSGVVENLDNDDPELIFVKRVEVAPSR
jgi:GNAT superfamily N-acetyltransferase